MTKEDTREGQRAELASLIERAMALADELKQPMTAAYLDQALNSALAAARAAGNQMV